MVWGTRFFDSLFGWGEAREATEFTSSGDQGFLGGPSIFSPPVRGGGLEFFHPWSGGATFFHVRTGGPTFSDYIFLQSA